MNPSSMTFYCHACGEGIGFAAICPHCQTENIFLDREEWPLPPHTGKGQDSRGSRGDVSTAPSPEVTAPPAVEQAIEHDAEEPVGSEATETVRGADSAATPDDSRTETMARKSKRDADDIIATLILREGSDREVQKFDLREGKTIVGREKAHLVLKSKKISRRHGGFIVRNARVFFIDNDSHNGTRINGGDDLLPKKPYLLRDQDEIEIGDVKYLVRVRAEEQGPDDRDVDDTDDADDAEVIEPTRTK